MLVSVCIPSIRPNTIGATLRSLSAQTRGEWEAIVVGQGDDLAVRTAVELEMERDPRIRFLHVPRRGVGRARNAAIRIARGEVLALLDDDCEASPTWLEVIVSILRSEPRVGAVGGAVHAPAARRGWPRRCPSLMPAEAVYDPVATPGMPPDGWNWIGCNFAMRGSVAAYVGDFDEFLGAGAAFPSGDDTDYKLRLEALGVVVRSSPRVVVRHTSGWRYGWRAVLRHQRNYARGNGGLAGKLSLLGDPRGERWLEGMRGLYLREARRNPARLLPALRGYRHYAEAYRECVATYRVDARGLLIRAVG